MRRQILWAAAALSLFSAAAAQAESRLAGSIAPFATGVRITGAANPGAMVHFQVVLKLRNRALMEQRLERHEVLTPGLLQADHMPLAADLASVEAWLKNAGLTIDGVGPAGTAIYASGTVARVSQALQMHFSAISSEGTAYVAADTAPAVPDAIAPLVLAINGLQPHLHAHKMLHSNTIVSSFPFLPSDFRNAYGAASQGTGGSGGATAIVIDTLPLKSDLTLFWQRAGVAGSLNNIAFINVLNMLPLPAQTDEATLDTETVSGIAPAAPLRVYAASSLVFSVLDSSFQRVISDMRAGVKIHQVTISLGACESDVPQDEADTDDQYFATMTSLGATVFVSSGDQGSHACGGTQNVASFYATSPHVTAVGGTDLYMAGASVLSETGWSGSTGGVSILFPVRPAWQAAVNGNAARTVPDIAADADPATGEMIILNGKTAEYGGTSLSSPICAALFGLINQKRVAAGKAPLGLLGPRTYLYVTTPKFRDITTGSDGSFAAHVGYDWVTGLGAPIISQLSPVLVAAP